MPRADLKDQAFLINIQNINGGGQKTWSGIPK